MRLKHRSTFDWLLTFLLMLLALAPLHLGANRSISSSALSLGASLLCLLTGIAVIIRKERPKIPASVALASLLMLAALGWAWVQTVHWTPDRWHNAVWTILAGSGAGDHSSAIAINVSAPFDAMMVLAAVIAIFWTSFILCQRLHRARRLLSGMVLIIALYAILGIGMVVTGWRPWADNTAERLVTSVFANRNHFAAYVNIGIVIALALVFGSPPRRDRDQMGAAVIWLHAIIVPMERSPIRTIALFIGLAALFGSQSRGGFLSLFLVFILFTLIQRPTKDAVINRPLITTIGFFLVVGVAMVLMGQPLLSRFDDISSETTLDVGGRLAAWSRTIELIGLSPWLGHGLGTYEDLFLMNTDERFTLIFDHAHNDYLEIIASLGLPAGGAFIAAICILTVRCAYLAGSADRNLRRFGLAALLSSIVAGAHSMVDFGLTIPALSVTLAAIVGAGCALQNNASSNS